MNDQNTINQEEEKVSWVKKLQTKWGLKNALQVFLVLIVFSCTGTTVLFLKQPIFELVGLSEMEGWKKTVLYLILIFPLYQVLLLAYAFVFGQFKFFWAFEKRTLGRIFKLFRRKK